MIKSLYIGLLSTVALTLTQPVSAQLLPQGWASVGYEDDVTFSLGARWINYGAEVGIDSDGDVGGDALLFFPVPLPLVSPYAGVGYYGGDGDNFAFSVGAQVRPRGENVFFGAGYHSIRGINGQLGLKF
jgi:hypothetical protein